MLTLKTLLLFRSSLGSRGDDAASYTSDTVMGETIAAGPLLLRRLEPAEARLVVESDRLPPPLRAARGWPHRDSYHGLRFAIATGGAFTWLVTLEGLVVGDCGTLGGADDAGTIAIGYGLAAPYRRRGYGTALVPALTGWLLVQPGVRLVVAAVEPGNRPSCRVLERAGFRRIDATRTELRYAFPPPPQR
jgi:RimJ/RimL family protein N-acetyltransferase